MSEIINSSLKTAVKSTTLVFLGQTANIILWFILKLTIVRNTNKEEFGIFSLCVAVANIFALVAGLGLQESISRHVSVLYGEGKKEEAILISRESLNISIISSLLFSALLFISAGMISRYMFYKPELEIPLKLVSFFIPFSVMSNIITAVFRGHNIMKPKVYLEMGHPFFFLLFLCVFLMLHFQFVSIIYAYIFSMAMVAALTGYYGIKNIGLTPFLLPGLAKIKDLLKFSAPLLIASLLGMALSWIDTLMLGRYTTAEDVGAYNISTSLAKLLIFPSGVIAFVFMPIAGEMYARKQYVELKKTYQVLTKWIFSCTFPVFFILFFFPEMTITFLFGERFIDAAVPLRILSLGFLLDVFLGVNGILLVVMGMSRKIMQMSALGIILNIGLNYILIKKLGYGIIGASIATAISYSALNVISSIVVYRRSRIHPITSQYTKPIAVSVIIALVIYAVAKSLPLYLWMIPIYFILFICGYFVSMLMAGGFDREDIFMFDTISQKTGFEMRFLRKIILAFSHG